AAPSPAPPIAATPSPAPIAAAPTPGPIGPAPAPGPVGPVRGAPVGAVRAIKVTAREIARPPIGAVVGPVAVGGPVAVVARAIRRPVAIARTIAIAIAPAPTKTKGVCGRAAPGEEGRCGCEHQSQSAH